MENKVFVNERFSFVNLGFVVVWLYDKKKHGFINHVNGIVFHELGHWYDRYVWSML